VSNETVRNVVPTVLHNPEHPLYQLLPERRHDITYSLQIRRHDHMISG